MPAIDINGKFLTGGLNGVHRTAAQYSEQLIKRMAVEHEVRLLAPPGAVLTPEMAHLNITSVAGRWGRGQGWEMITLPRQAKGRLLVNLCNLAPLLHANSVAMIHDAQIFLHPKDYSPRQVMAYKRLLPWIGRRARRIITVSEYARQTLARYRIAPFDKIDVVHNGTDHLLTVEPDRRILERHGLERGEYVLAIGTAKHYKNLSRVFDALREALPGGRKLVVAGGPAASTYSAKGWQPPEHAVLTGFVTDGELRALYESAAVFVFPSLTEGFGLPPVEAMHFGTPVVSARAGAMPEVCGDAVLLVDPDDPRAFRSAILSILENDLVSEDLAGKGRARAQQLTWEHAGQRLYAIISSLLEEDARNPPCDRRASP